MTASAQTLRNRSAGGRKAAAAKKRARMLREALAGATATQGTRPVISSIDEVIARIDAAVAARRAPR